MFVLIGLLPVALRKYMGWGLPSVRIDWSTTCKNICRACMRICVPCQGRRVTTDIAVWYYHPYDYLTPDWSGIKQLIIGK